MTKLTADSIALALTMAQLTAPIDTEITKTHIVLSFKGNYSGAISAVTSALKSAELNYPDPRPDTQEVRGLVERLNATQVKTTVTLTRISQKQYNTILDSARDTDGDGKSELPDAPDADGDGLADDTGAEIVSGGASVSEPPMKSSDMMKEFDAGTLGDTHPKLLAAFVDGRIGKNKQGKVTVKTKTGTATLHTESTIAFDGDDLIVKAA